MNCENCYHYQACSSVDVTGYVNGLEKTPEEACEHFLDPKEVRPTAHWVRQVGKFISLPNFCVGCGAGMNLDETDHTNRVTID